MNNKLVLSLFATALVSAAAQGATASISASYNNLTNVVTITDRMDDRHEE